MKEVFYKEFFGKCDQIDSFLFDLAKKNVVLEPKKDYAQLLHSQL